MISSRQFAEALFCKMELEPNPISRKALLEFGISAHTEDLRAELVHLKRVVRALVADVDLVRAGKLDVCLVRTMAVVEALAASHGGESGG